jgi:predicted lipoprotein with Yx(FWY)xxD motif
MKHLFVSLSLILLLNACSNAPKADNSSNSGAGEVSPEVMENPATAADPTKKPEAFAVMTFKTMEHNFGDILENQKVETTYEFTNTGKVDLLISNCSAMCGCTVPDWPREPIKPGEKGSIKVVFDSAGKSGTNNKIVTVYANIESKTLELKFSANVRAIK